VGGDVSIAGGVVSLLADSRVSGDVLVVGGKLSLLGTVEGTVYLAGGDIFIDGKIVGNVRLYSAGDVHIGKNAVIGGDLIYHSAREAIIEPGAVIKGKTQFTYAPPFVSAPDLRGFFAGLFGALFVTRLLVLLVAGLLFVLVFRRASGSLARVSQESFWKHALVGLAVLVAVPFASLVLALTIFGGLVAAMLFALWIFMLLVAQVYAGVVAARIFEVYVLKRTPGHLVSWQAAVLGILGLNVACLVPFVGLFICLLFLLVALGSLSYLGYRQFLLAR
jgi:hypothetical protein